MRLRKFPWLFILLAMWLPATLPAQMTVPLPLDDIQLVGTLGDTLRIEMLLQGDGKHTFFEAGGDTCRNVTGVYYRRHEMQPIPLSGQICFPKRSIVLHHFEDAIETERFVGKWEPGTRTLSGTWESRHAKQPLRFSLSEANCKGNDFFPWLLHLANERLMQRWIDPEGRPQKLLSYSNLDGDNVVRVDEHYEITALHLSSSRIALERRYPLKTNLSRSLDIFQMLPWGEYALHYAEISNDFLGDRQEDGPVSGGSRCDFEIKIFQIQHMHWAEVTAQFQRVVLALERFRSTNSGCDATILSEAIRLGEERIILASRLSPKK